MVHLGCLQFLLIMNESALAYGVLYEHNYFRGKLLEMEWQWVLC